MNVPLGTSTMNSESLTRDLLAPYRRFALVQPHQGMASFRIGNEAFSGPAEFLVPQSGQAIIALRRPENLSTQDFGRDLVVEGNGELGFFRIHCDQIYVRKPQKFPTGHSWCLISPVNGPAQIHYVTERPVRRGVALLSNFDLTYGDPVTTASGGTRIGTPLNVEVGGRSVTFRQRTDRPQLLPMVQAKLLHSACFVEMAFVVNHGESDDVFLNLLADVAAMCSFASGVRVSVAMVDLFDGEGTIVRRIVPQSITSWYRDNRVVDDFQISRLFSECFSEYTRMRETHAPWAKLADYCGFVDDAPFLEQKFASLIMAVEFLLRNILRERGESEATIVKRRLHSLIGAAREHLNLQIPKHYTAKDTVRELRNAVIHGGESTISSNAEFRHLFDKWKLFLFRIILIRLGYRGEVISPYRGWRSSSNVDDFSEEHNIHLPEALEK